MGFTNYFFTKSRRGYSYVYEGISNWGLNSFYAALTYYILYNQLIPIALVGSAEISKFIATISIEWDYQFCSLEQDLKGRCNNFSLHEDLGAIKHIFTDKTGTLTSNKLTFRGITIGHARGAIEFENKNQDLLANDIRNVLLAPDRDLSNTIDEQDDIKE